MKPNRNFRFKNKTEIFAVVGFRYDSPTSIEYDQRKNPESVADIVRRLLSMENGADIISIRRVYLEKVPEMEPILEKVLA